MKNIKNLIFGGGLILLLMTSCSKDEIKYDTAVVRAFDFQLNGEPWSLNVGITTKPLFIYKEDGSYLANYNSEFRFSLDNGKYYFVGTDIPAEMIPNPTNLNDLIIPQSPTAAQKVNLSDPMPYESPFAEKLTMNILTRTGTLRLKSTDVVADKSYTQIKTTVAVKRTGYKASDGSYIKGDMTVSRTRATASGGLNYTDDFIVFQTGDDANNVHIKIEYLAANLAVVYTKEFEGSFPIKANGVTQVDFNLNDPGTSIKDYKLTINGVVTPK
jgi:hypothetical protein